MKRLRLFLLTILCGKEVADMAIVYATLIVKGKKTRRPSRRGVSRNLAGGD